MPQEQARATPKWRTNFSVILFLRKGSKEPETILLGRVPMIGEFIHGTDGRLYKAEAVTHLANRNPIELRCSNEEEHCSLLAAPVAFVIGSFVDELEVPEIDECVDVALI